MGAFYSLFFFVRTPVVGVKEHSIWLRFCLSMYSRQHSESENFLAYANAIALSIRPRECESINYKLMADRAAKKDSG